MGDMGGVIWKKMKGKCNNLFIFLSVNIHLIYKAVTQDRMRPLMSKLFLIMKLKSSPIISGILILVHYFIINYKISFFHEKLFLRFYPVSAVALTIH